MLYFDDLKCMKLYKKRGVYLPINYKDKKHGSAILLLSPNYATSNMLMNNDFCVNKNNSFMSYYIEKGVLCYRVKFSEEGLRVLKEAEALAPQQPDIHYLLGRLYMQKGDSKEAASCLKKAIELGHPDAEAVLKQIVN